MLLEYWLLNILDNIGRHSLSSLEQPACCKILDLGDLQPLTLNSYLIQHKDKNNNKLEQFPRNYNYKLQGLGLLFNILTMQCQLFQLNFQVAVKKIYFKEKRKTDEF